MTTNETPDAIRTEAIIKSALAAVMADGVIDPAEIDLVQAVFAQATGEELSRDLVRAELEGIQNDSFDIIRYLDARKPTLDRETRLNIIRVTYCILTSDGSYEKTEKSMLEQLARVLDIDESVMQRTLEDLRARA